MCFWKAAQMRLFSLGISVSGPENRSGATSWMAWGIGHGSTALCSDFCTEFTSSILPLRAICNWVWSVWRADKLGFCGVVSCGAAIARGIPRFCVTGSAGERPAGCRNNPRKFSRRCAREVNDPRDNTGSLGPIARASALPPLRSKVALLRNCSRAEQNRTVLRSTGETFTARVVKSDSKWRRRSLLLLSSGSVV